jgi:uncharacterized protein (DUF362 family)/NAD-dependent dihydropyrimidine dehydrogenase PreA subunit
MSTGEQGTMQERATVSIVACESYVPDCVRPALETALAPLGGMRRFVRPGMRVLLKPNLLKPIEPERGITTHPSVIQAVAEMVLEAGGVVWIGDSPGGPSEQGAQAMHQCGVMTAAEVVGAQIVPFDKPVWKRLSGVDYFVASPALEADLVIDLPKLKTHILTLYTGGVKNLFGTITGTRKRELHLYAPGVKAFGSVLVDVLELIQPALTIMDGVLGLHGEGPGMGGTPHLYGCLAAATDPVALDAVVSRAMGYRAGEVLHLDQAHDRGLGLSDPDQVRIVGDLRALEFGPLDLPRARWYLRLPSWVGVPVRRMARVRPQVEAALCIGCGRCAEVCPRSVITPGRPPEIRLDDCIGCLCCAEICPQGAIHARRNLLARLIGIGY